MVVKSIQAAAYNGTRTVVITKEIGIFFQIFLAFLEYTGGPRIVRILGPGKNRTKD